MLQRLLRLYLPPWYVHTCLFESGWPEYRCWCCGAACEDVGKFAGSDENTALCPECRSSVRSRLGLLHALKAPGLWNRQDKLVVFLLGVPWAFWWRTRWAWRAVRGHRWDRAKARCPCGYRSQYERPWAVFEWAGFCPWCWLK